MSVHKIIAQSKVVVRAEEARKHSPFLLECSISSLVSVDTLSRRRRMVVFDCRSGLKVAMKLFHVALAVVFASDRFTTVRALSMRFLVNIVLVSLQIRAQAEHPLTSRPRTLVL
jgi:hypothetical protein